MHGALLIALLQAARVGGTEPDTTRPVPDSADLATAYVDEGARELVRLARGHRGLIDASVFHYAATSHQRISVGVRALRRQRLLYLRETASHVDWWRDRPSRVRVEGAREAIPIALPGLRVPDGLEDWAREFVPEPKDDRLFAAITTNGFAWHPLVEGGEALYRYATGDTTVISLPDGSRIRLVELRAIPRERDVRVVTGSFWIELDDYAIVKAVFRPARSFDLERDLARFDPEEEGELDEVPGILKPITFDVEYLMVDYGYWELRWWMPRLMAFHGSLRMGPATFPVTIENRYYDYTVEADPLGLPELPPLIRHLAGDPTSRPRPYEYPIRVEVADSASLLDSPLLAESFYSAGEALITDDELRTLSDQLGGLPPSPWAVERPRVTPPWTPGRGLLRYNRVEELSAGARVDWDMGRARIDLTARLGTGDLEPRGELGVAISAQRRDWRLAAYNRLAVADPSLRPLGLWNSLTALMFGRDDGTYFRASGAEVRVSPRDGTGYALRLYAERQRAAAVHTDWSFPHLFGGTDVFRPNIDAMPADQVGMAMTAGGEVGLDPTAPRWGGWVDITAETGTYTFVRPGVTLRAAAPVLGLLVAVEVAGGTTFASGARAPPLQAEWFLGGPGTLRGFPGGSYHGADFGRVRTELANQFPGARLALFADAGWAGSAEDFMEEDTAVSVGVGASLLDGLLRMDLARPLRPASGVRLELYMDAIF